MPKPCQGCILYEAPKLLPATEFAINLYWQANGGKADRARFKATKYRMPEWLAEYVFEVWAIYDTIVSEVRRQREGAQQNVHDSD